jgi:hypothetical protein
MRRIELPIRGAESVRTFKDGRPGFAPVDRLRNVRTFSRTSGRPQIGKRFGWTKLVQQRLSTMPVQAIRECPRSSFVTGYSLGDAAPVTSGDSREATAITGNYWLLDSVPSLTRDLFFDVTGDSGPATNAVTAAAARPALQGTPPYGVVAVATTYTHTPSGLTRVRVQLVRTDTQAVVATQTLSSTTLNLRCNSLHFGREFLYVCGSRLWVLRAGDLSLVASFDMDGWASEIVQCGTYVHEGVEYLFVGFNGADVGGQPYGPAGSPPVGTIVGGHPAVHFRTGVRKFQVDESYANPSGPYVTSSVLNWVQFGQYRVGLNGDNAGSNFYEADHFYFRISERSAFAPRGCLITGLAVSQTTGDVFITRTNTGYGPDTGYLPDVGLSGRISVMGITGGFRTGDRGATFWEADVDSIVAVGLNGYYNDILDPTLKAVVVDANNKVYVSGRLTAGSKSLWRLSAADGSIERSAALQGAVGSVQPCAGAFDATDGSVWFAGTRNNSWDGSGGAQAHLWKIRPTELTVAASFDLASAVAGRCVAITPAGEIVYGTDKV